MAGIKEKISATVDKLTHKHHTQPTTGATTAGTDTGGAANLGNTSSYSTGTGTGVTGTGATGTGVTGQDYSTTSGTGGYDTTSGTGGLGTTGATTGTETTGYGTTGATGTTTGVTGGTAGQGAIIDSETFTKTEDHEVLIEKKQYELEHRPVQKQYVVETRLAGETAVQGKPTEYVGSEAREVDERVKRAPAGDRTVVVENVDVPESAVRETTSTGYDTGATGTGYGTGTTGTGTGTTGTGTGTTY